MSKLLSAANNRHSQDSADFGDVKPSLAIARSLAVSAARDEKPHARLSNSLLHRLRRVVRLPFLNYDRTGSLCGRLARNSQHFSQARIGAAFRRCDAGRIAAAFRDAAAWRLIRRAHCARPAPGLKSHDFPLLDRHWRGCSLVFCLSRRTRGSRGRRDAICGYASHALAVVPAQMVDIGLQSQLVVVITGGFTGAVFAAQTYFQFNKLGVASGVGAVVSAALFRELGPVLTGLMVTGRVGAAMSAEIGTMKVTEQIDALRALAVHPVDYLVVPRMLAMMISMPLLVAECIGFGLVAVLFCLGPFAWNQRDRITWRTWSDGHDRAILIMGVTKGFCFAILIVFISCHKGLTAARARLGWAGRRPKRSLIRRSHFDFEFFPNDDVKHHFSGRLVVRGKLRVNESKVKRRK